jgi:hypothetical protein
MLDLGRREKVMRKAGLIGGILSLTWTIAWGETAATVTSDPKFVDELVADLGFRPRGLLERVRYLAGISYEAPMQRRLSYCVEAYADRIATDAELHEKVVSEVEQRACARFQTCPSEGLKRVDQSSAYAELLRVLAGEMRGEKRAETSQVFMEHEAFVEFGRRLARLKGIEEAFGRAAAVNGEVSAPHILASCPRAWSRWPILLSGFITTCLLVGALAVYYKRKMKSAPI